MATYHFLAIHPGQTLLVDGHAIRDGQAVDLSEARRDSLLADGVHFRETEPKAGEPDRARQRAHFGPNRAEVAAMKAEQEREEAKARAGAERVAALKETIPAKPAP